MPRIYNVYFLGKHGQVEVGTFTDLKSAKSFQSDCVYDGTYVKSSQHDLGKTSNNNNTDGGVK